MIALADLLEALAPARARLIGPASATVFDGFAYDSRTLRPGELFLAVRTARADGHDFIPDANSRGAAGVLGDRLGSAPTPGCTSIAVDDVLLGLRCWARFILERHRPKVIAVLGRTGKTTAAKAVVAVLGHGFGGGPAIFDGDNHGTLYGLPIALGKLTAAHSAAVLEFAREQPGDLMALAEITRPSMAVVVRGFDEPAANQELADFVARLPADGHLILNADDPRLEQLGDHSPAPTLRYGRISAAAVKADQIDCRTDATYFVLSVGASRERVYLRLLGDPAVDGALAGAAVGVALDYHPTEIAASLERAAPLPGRLCPLPGANGSRIIDDSYNADTVALTAALSLLDRWPGRKTVVLGALSTAASDDSREVHRAAGQTIAGHASRLVTLGSGVDAAALAARAHGFSPGDALMAESVDDAARVVRSALDRSDLVLVLGGAEARLERVVERLLAEPSHAPDLLIRQDAGWKRRVFLSHERPTWVEIDLGAIGANVSRLKAIAEPAALMAVLKADAYGHGALRAARTALLHGADYLATACLGEAVALRRQGIVAPILILGFTPPWQAPDIVRHDLTATIYSLEPVRHLARTVQTLGHNAARVQIKVDTGMGRLGLLPPDVPAFVDALRAIPEVEIEGIFTHFACADGADPSPTRVQIARFDQVLEELSRAGWQPRYVHAANSAAIFRFPEARYSMVRAGIALYGLDPSEHVRCPAGFRPALTFKTLVAQVKELPAGSPIGYGGTFVTARPSRIAVLPVGYGDGFRRSPHDWHDVLVRGQRAPIVGVVCMDMCMIDVTDVPGVRPGDEVVLIGRQGQDEITVAEAARKLGTIPYEVVTQLLARVPREVAPEA
ncbi:MAG TPA: alanine racemase [Chloroflexota bacterium]|nr:alanine racemase [Chloroflexota bacterium]